MSPATNWGFQGGMGSGAGVDVVQQCQVIEVQHVRLEEVRPQDQVPQDAAVVHGLDAGTPIPASGTPPCRAPSGRRRRSAGCSAARRGDRGPAGSSQTRGTSSRRIGGNHAVARLDRHFNVEMPLDTGQRTNLNCRHHVSLLCVVDAVWIWNLARMTRVSEALCRTRGISRQIPRPRPRPRHRRATSGPGSRARCSHDRDCRDNTHQLTPGCDGPGLFHRRVGQSPHVCFPRQP